jgi:hypothetical protein
MPHASQQLALEWHWQYCVLAVSSVQTQP